ncbi:hypothetical protein VitviT2T_011993 [Vitis vinifera]|uniref:PA domain-containing protein n=1 Tax=Vitis vinifera TaxID=29760 RepID=A0ABY9CCE5_VITVI|nr:hypothetical protein VitviT2T_011993 [Vitis vinifera]
MILRVTYPESLKDAYECATGNFGIPQNEHGGTVVGTVVYPQANQKSCSRSHHFDVSFKSQPADLPIFLLADRGNCYFALKVWSAQNAGAAAVLIADNINITIPSALITKALGDRIKEALSAGEMVTVNLDLEGVSSLGEHVEPLRPR